MPIEPANLSAAIAGAHAAHQTHARTATKKEESGARKPTTPRDAVEFTVTEVEHDNAVRDLKDSAQEESHEDHQASGTDTPPKHLDLEA